MTAQVKASKAAKAVLDVLFLDDKGEWIKHEWAAFIGQGSRVIRRAQPRLEALLRHRADP
ncbi:MAG: hypothetical protein R3B91_23165 [Planctomycetaceae bacterium]